MIEDLKAFNEKVKEDKTLQEKVQEILKNSSQENVADNFIAEAAAQGYNFTKEDMQTFAEDQKAELSDEDLEKVSGGSDVVLLTVAGAFAMFIGSMVGGAAIYDAVKKSGEEKDKNKN